MIFQKKAEPQDILIWFIASHGTVDGAGNYHVVAHDTSCQGNHECIDLSNTISANDILTVSKKIPALNQIFVMDTCHAGAVDDSISGLYDAKISVLAKNMGLHLMAGASPTELASDGIGENGMFTQSILKGFNGFAKDLNADKKISFGELGDYAKTETEKQAYAQNKSQSPIIRSFGKDIAMFTLTK